MEVVREQRDRIRELEAQRPNEYEKELGHLPPTEDRRNMTSFIGHCVSACWAAYAEIGDLIGADYYKRTHGQEINADKYGARQTVKSWLYDAASILTIVSHDGELLSLLSEWYERDGGIPWNREGDWRKTDER
jgi:hypothetical protein